MVSTFSVSAHVEHRSRAPVASTPATPGYVSLSVLNTPTIPELHQASHSKFVRLSSHTMRIHSDPGHDLDEGHAASDCVIDRMYVPSRGGAAVLAMLDTVGAEDELCGAVELGLTSDGEL
jgi:hypothetical protein